MDVLRIGLASLPQSTRCPLGLLSLRALWLNAFDFFEQL